MFRENTNILYIVIIFVLAQEAGAQNMDIHIESNKAEYICGEPVLLRTVVCNDSNEKVQIYDGGWINRERGFTIYVAYDGNDFENILDIKTKLRLGISTPPTQYDFFVDFRCLPSYLLPSEKSERIDILIIPKSGYYKLKAVLRDHNGKIIYSSLPDNIRVISPKEKYDSILQLGDPNVLINLGSTIYYAHYLQKLWGGYSPGVSLNKEEFAKIAPIIIEKCKDSAFREYAIYADIMTSWKSDTRTNELTDGRKEVAEHFVQEYLNSWLLPDVYNKLFLTYIAEKNKEKAEEVRRKALSVAPNSTVIRFIKEKDVNDLVLN